jgi:hypothetical protein
MKMMKILERKDGLATSKIVLVSKGFQGDVNDEALKLAAKYFLESGKRKK